MVHYIAKRVISSLATLFVIVSVTFALLYNLPGDPFAEDKPIPEEIRQAMMEHYGLNDPWHIQYGRYLYRIVTWDLGPSFKYKARTVNEIIREGFPVSAALGLQALCLALAAGISLGSIAALRHNRWQDYSSMGLAVAGISIPSFILATMLQYIFSLKLGWLPVARWGTLAQSILPAVALAALPTSFIARLTRSNMLEVLQQDYIKTARAKGVSEARLITKHALRNALLPVMPYLGQLAANILVGSFIIERIFSIPGLGQWFVTSVNNRDYTVIMGVTVFYSAILLAAMLAVDLLYSWLDPRIKLGGAGND